MRYLWVVVVFSGGCGRPVVQLPPLGAPAAEPAQTSTNPNDQNAEPELPLQVAFLLQGKMVVYLKDNQQMACFPDGGATCTGKVRSEGKTVNLGTTDVCRFTYPGSNVHLVVTTPSGSPLLDARIPIPPLSTFTSIPTEIGDDANKLSLNLPCQL